MTLQKQIVGIPIKGLNTQANDKSAVPGECVIADNVFFHRTARGGGELKKRYGGANLAKTGAVGAEPTVTTGRKLATFDNERLLLADDRLHSYSPQFGGWSGKGKISNVGVTLEHVSEVAALGQFTGGTGCAAPDVAINGNLMCVAWMDTATSRSAYYAVIDRNTGERLTSDIAIGGSGGAATWVRVVALASEFMLVLAKGSTNQILVETVQYSNLGGTGGLTSIALDLNASCKGDVIRNGTNDSVLVAYHTTVPDFKALVINANRTAGASSSFAEAPTQAVGWLHWDFSDGKAYVGYVGAATGLRFATFNLGTSAWLSSTVADAALVVAAQVTGFRTGTVNNLFVEVRAATSYNCVVKWWSTTTGGAAATLIRSVGLGARVFKVSAKYYVPFTYESPLQNTYFIGEVDGAGTKPTIVARSLYGLGGGLSLTANIPQPQVMADGTTVLVPAMRLTTKLGSTPFYGISIANLDFAGSGLSSPRRVGDNLHVPGGVVRAYSGEGSNTDFLGELGFFLFPETPTLAQSAGGALTLLGVYQYVAVYAFTDARGQIHRSAPSDIATFTLTGANATITVTVPTLRVSAKLGIFGTAAGSINVTVEVYGTQASGTTFYRLPSQTGNDASVDTVNASDAQTDTAKGANEVLYTSGKVLPHISPPAAKLMESWRNRLFLAGTENPLELWPSNEYDPGNGVSFSDVLVVTMEAEGGPITALAEMDDRLLIFKRGAIYALGGNGPTLTGGNPYEQPVRVCSHVGAVQQAGVVKTRDGVMFVSPRGIYMYTRGGETVYVGAAIDSLTTPALALVISGACVLEDEEQVRFVTSSGTGVGTTFVYHYGLLDDKGIGRWTTFSGQTAVDCIVWNKVFARLASDGTVTEETANAYSDPGSTAITATVKLVWMSLTQFFGRFKLYRVFIHGDVLASFNLTHELWYDFEAALTETETNAVTATTDFPLATSPARRRATAFQLRVNETSTTQGFTVSEVGLEVGLEPGAQKPNLGHTL